MSILIVALVDIFRLQSKELRAYYNLKIEQKQKGVQDSAANIIKYSLKLRKLKKVFQRSKKLHKEKEYLLYNKR